MKIIEMILVVPMKQILSKLRLEKTCLWGFRPVPTQTGLYAVTDDG